MIDSIWNKYSDKLFFFLNKRVRNKEVAHNLVQDTFQKAISNQETLSNVDNIEAWLMSIARNTLIDYTRRKKEVALDDLRLINTSEFKSDKENAVEGIAECLKKLISEYDQEDQELLLDVFNKSMTQKEMAETLDIPYNTFKSRIQRARNYILTEFKERHCTLIRNKKGEIIDCNPI